MAYVVRSVEEWRTMPPLTEEEIARRRAIVHAILEEARLEHEEYVRNGGHVMTEEERQRFWDTQYDDDDDEWLTPAK